MQNAKLRTGFIGAMGLLIAAALLPAGCASNEASTEVRVEDDFMASHAWLKQNVTVSVDRQELNRSTGLLEVDATITARQIRWGRQGYRIVARTWYYGEGQSVADTSAWHEVTLVPGRGVNYSCTSLVPAKRCTIELAYPEDMKKKAERT